MLNVVKLKKTIKQNLKLSTLKITFETTNRLKNSFRYEDLVPETLHSNRVCKFSCGKFTSR